MKGEKLEVSTKVMRVVDSGHDEQNPVLLATVNLTHSKKTGQTRRWSKLVLMKGS